MITRSHNISFLNQSQLDIYVDTVLWTDDCIIHVMTRYVALLEVTRRQLDTKFSFYDREKNYSNQGQGGQGGRAMIKLLMKHLPVLGITRVKKYESPLFSLDGHFSFPKTSDSMFHRKGSDLTHQATITKTFHQ